MNVLFGWGPPTRCGGMGRQLSMTILLLAGFCRAESDESGQGNRLREALIIKGHFFEFELALTSAQRQRGLMGRGTIPFDGGMIFVFEKEEEQSFWMANCLTDLDIAFLDSTGRIRATHTMRVEAPRGEHETREQYEDRMKRYPSNGPVSFAVEFKAGTLALLGLEPGGRIPLDPQRLMRIAGAARTAPAD